MKWNPEKASDFVRGLWMLMSVFCTVSSLAYVCVGNASRAFAIAAAGVCFFAMGHYRHDDLD